MKTLTRPRALVLRAAGTNCDRETAHAFELAGADATTLHVNRLLESPEQLANFDLLAIPGGFSYGDDIAAGRIFADRLSQLGDGLKRFVDAGKPIVGICNGFQVLVQAGLLPGDLDGRAGRSTALTWNDSGTFQCQWVTLRKASRNCVWTSTWGDDEAVELPMAHAEGRIAFADDAARDAVRQAGRIALTYNDNPNGADLDVAGLTDATGLVLGLMPHPERYVDHLQHPAWTRHKADGKLDDGEITPGLRLFQAAVGHATRRLAGK